MEDGWKAAYSSGSAYMVGDLVNESGDLDGWLIDKSNQVRLTPEEFTLLKDHAIKRCPDGTYLHTASANLVEQNDSAYAWRYDENFEAIGHSEVELKTPDRAHNDMANICSHLAQGVAFPSTGFGEGENLFFYLDENAAPEATVLLPEEPRMSGGAFLTDVHEDLIYGIGFGLYTRDLMILTYDGDFNLLDQTQLPVLNGWRAYWSQGFIQVGDYFLVALMGAEDSNPDGDDIPDPAPPIPSSDDGNVFLLVLDQDWNLVEEIQLTDHVQGFGGMRPWLARKGDQVLMTYDVWTEHSLVEIRLDIDAFGLNGNSPDTGVNPDFVPYYYGGEDDTGLNRIKSCGNCSSVSAGSTAPWLLGILGLVAIRRQH
jgi:MYXO-CTERM domain-containing protein